MQQTNGSMVLPIQLYGTIVDLLNCKAVLAPSCLVLSKRDSRESTKTAKFSTLATILFYTNC